jgi:hypothetical protein
MADNDGKIMDFIIFFSLAIIIYTYYEGQNSELVYAVSPYDNNKYLVRNLKDKNKALLLLSSMSKKLTTIVTKMEEVYDTDDRVMRLKEKFNSNNISETAANSTYTSYSVNKGEKLVLCLRSKTNQHDFIDENTLFFVALHEISHIMTLSIGHTEEFWENFRFLLKEATSLGMYKCVDYDNMPKSYCGIKITNSPLKCDI